MGISHVIELDGQYRLLREEAGWFEPSERSKLLIKGADAAEFLHSQLTNDIESIEPNEGCYAALLDRKGHMQADMRVLQLASGDLWMDTEASALATLMRHLDTYRIGREVEIEDVSEERSLLSVIGPAAFELVAVPPIPREHGQRAFERNGVEVLAVATDLGVDLIVRAGDLQALDEGLLDDAIARVSEDAAEIIRVEAGRPRFGFEMSAATIPEEAGINDRAVSFTKGCYIGQETVARLHYKGKPNRALRGLRLEAAVANGDPVMLGEREVGKIGTAALSPAAGPLALAILRREAEAGNRVLVGEGGVAAEVVELPFR